MSSNGDSGPGAISEMLGLVAYAFAELQPYLPMYTHLVVSALFPIFTGAYSSLSRPSSAAKSPKKPKGRRSIDEQDEEDDDSSIQKMEGLSPSDAVMFPLLAGCTLGGLYLLIKYMGAVLLNKILRWYFSAMAIFSVAKLVNDGLGIFESFCFPQYYVDDAVLWRVNHSKMQVVHSASCSRPSPLPGVLGRIILPQSVIRALWFLRGFLRQKYNLRFHLARLISFKGKLSLRAILSAFAALAAVFSSNFLSNAWWLTNLQGFAFSYSALQLMSPTTFPTGSLVLAALFFYDIYFVFYTPLMVTVATKLDVPIKLLFPRPLDEGQDPSTRKLAMLGLGDIVIPGMMIGLALRFDLYMFYLKKQQKRAAAVSAETGSKDTTKKADQDVQKESYRSVTGHWGNKFWTKSWTARSLLPKDGSSPIPSFPKPYFYASVIGYILGMCTTLGVMQVFKHAQPALLYLVPGVLTSLWSTSVIRGEAKQMWEFSEASDEEEEKSKDKKEKIKDGNKEKDGEEKERNEAKKEEKPSSLSWFSDSFFSTSKTERNAQNLEKHISKTFSNDTDDDDNIKDAKADTKGSKNKATKPKGFFRFSLTRDTPPLPHHPTSEPSKLSTDRKRASSSAGEDGRGGSAKVSGFEGGGEENTPRWRAATTDTNVAAAATTATTAVGKVILGGDEGVSVERAGKRRRI